MARYPILILGLALACFMVVFMAGCTQPQGGDGKPTPTPTAPIIPSQSFDQESNGKQVTAPAGSAFSVTLPENPTTGYSWNLVHSAGLTLLNDEFIPPSTQLVGAGGTRLWLFSAVEKGNQSVHGEYRRPWVPAGTVVLQDLEGGFYGIVGDDGKDYLPLNLGADYRVDGLRVSFESEPAGDVSTIYMCGTPVNLTFIETTDVYDLHVLVN